MLKIKQSQVMISLIDGIGTIALGLFLIQLTGLVWLGYVGSALMFGSAACILILNQDENHTNRNGYWNLALYAFSMVMIGLVSSWIVSVLLFVVSIGIGLRYLSNNIGPKTK